MRPYSFITAFGVCVLLLAACKKDSTDTNKPVLKLSPDNITNKSGRTITSTLQISAPDGIRELRVTKGINLQPDNLYGTGGVVLATPVATGDNTWEYKFSYRLDPDEIDKLVGFNFHFEDNQGRIAEKDLTVNTTASGAQIIATHKWILKSKLWESATPASETIEDCAKDNIYQWNRDSSITIAYGTKGCTFDGFNVFDKWRLSDDEKTFTQIYHSLFDPTNITTEVYNVRSISKDKLVMDITLDLSIFGPPYTDHDKFVYTYEAAP